MIVSIVCDQAMLCVVWQCPFGVWQTFTESPIPTVISKIMLKNIPAGTTIKYTHPVEGPKEWVSVGVASEL